MTSRWEVVIGLEIHTQLSTKSKIFSGAATVYGSETNTQACIIDLGYPGILPVSVSYTHLTLPTNREV